MPFASVGFDGPGAANFAGVPWHDAGIDETRSPAWTRRVASVERRLPADVDADDVWVAGVVEPLTPWRSMNAPVSSRSVTPGRNWAPRPHRLLATSMAERDGVDLLGGLDASCRSRARLPSTNLRVGRHRQQLANSGDIASVRPGAAGPRFVPCNRLRSHRVHVIPTGGRGGSPPAPLVPRAER